MIYRFECIQQSYEKQCEDIMNYVEMVDDLRQVVYKNIRDIGGTPSSTAANEYLQAPPPLASTSVRSHPFQSKEDESSHPEPTSSGEEDNNSATNSNKTLKKTIRDTTRKTIQQAEEGFIKLDHVIRQLRTSMHKK
jgi:hypothetical protein